MSLVPKLRSLLKVSQNRMKETRKKKEARKRLKRRKPKKIPRSPVKLRKPQTQRTRLQRIKQL